MRYEGDIEVIRKIEQYIIDNTQHDAVKKTPHTQVCPIDIEPSYYVKTFTVYVMFFEFDIRLAYDLRSNKGKYEMPDKNSHILFTKHPELSNLLSNMNSINLSEYSGGKKNIEVIPIKETHAQTI